jgi:hypothetical protein
MGKKISFLITTLVLSLIVFSVACTHKSLPEITSRATEPLKKEKPTKTITPDLITGKAIFNNRCGNCHDLPPPEQFTTQRWDGILSYMIPRARLTDEQGVHVTAYIKANAGK